MERKISKKPCIGRYLSSRHLVHEVCTRPLCYNRWLALTKVVLIGKTNNRITATWKHKDGVAACLPWSRRLRRHHSPINVITFTSWALVPVRRGDQVAGRQQDEPREHPERGQTTGAEAAAAGMQHRNGKGQFWHLGKFCRPWPCALWEIVWLGLYFLWPLLLHCYILCPVWTTEICYYT